MGLFSWRKKKKRPSEAGDEAEMSFLDHLEELRWHLFRSVIAILAAAVVLFVFRIEIIGGIFMSPFKEDFVTYRILCEHVTDQFCPDNIKIETTANHQNDSIDLKGFVFEDVIVEREEKVGDSTIIKSDTVQRKKEMTFKIAVKDLNKSGPGEVVIESPRGTLVKIQATSPYEQFVKSMVYAFFGGLIIMFPYIIFELWRFIRPALERKEVRKVRWNVLVISSLFFTGVSFGYFIILPISVQFLSNFVLFEEAENIWRIGDVISFELMLLFGTGLIFQLPVLVYYLSLIGLVSTSFLKKYRKHAVVVLLIISAFITPPDPLSQVLVFLPLSLLYQMGIFIAGRVEKRRQKEEEEEQKVRDEERKKYEAAMKKEEARKKEGSPKPENKDEDNE